MAPPKEMNEHPKAKVNAVHDLDEGNSSVISSTLFVHELLKEGFEWLFIH